MLDRNVINFLREQLRLNSPNQKQIFDLNNVDYYEQSLRLNSSMNIASEGGEIPAHPGI